MIAYPIECNNESNREGRVKCGSTLGTVGSSIVCWHPIHLREGGRRGKRDRKGEKGRGERERGGGGEGAVGIKRRGVREGKSW